MPLPVIESADPRPHYFKTFRAKFGMSQRQAAAFIGIGGSTWRNWETRGARPQVAALLLVMFLAAKPELMDALKQKLETGTT